jgi:broad specificity phosphatase PhoE
MLTLVLTRHGLTERSVPEQHLGQHLDVSISDDGRRQAAALAKRLAGVRFDRAITSPLFRARETAEIIAASTSGPDGRGDPVIDADPRLREMDYGAWEGRTYEEIEASDGAYRREFEASPDQLSCPGGESGLDVADRVRSFLSDLLDEHRSWRARASFRAATSAPGAAGQRLERPVLAVGHATTNRILLCVALGVSVAEYRRRFIQDPANLTVLRWQPDAAADEAMLLVMNDRSHLVSARDAGSAAWEHDD